MDDDDDDTEKKKNLISNRDPFPFNDEDKVLVQANEQYVVNCSTGNHRLHEY